MNKRIRELANESGYIYYMGGTVPYFQFSNNQLKKFAELIVQECVVVCRTGVTEGDFELANHAADRILRHFGVDK